MVIWWYLSILQGTANERPVSSQAYPEGSCLLAGLVSRISPWRPKVCGVGVGDVGLCKLPNINQVRSNDQSSTVGVTSQYLSGSVLESCSFLSPVKICRFQICNSGVVILDALG